MKTYTTAPAVARWWTPSAGALLSAGVFAALFLVFSIGGCQEEVPGIVNVCIPPTVIRTSPSNADTNVSFNKGQVSHVKSGIAAAKLITATFSTQMDPNSITTSTFLVRQGTTSISGLVSYSGQDSTAVFVAPNGLGPDLVYTCTITTGAKDMIGTSLAANYVWTFTTIALGTPTLVSPVNGAVNQATNPVMVWNVVPGADTYRLQVSLSPDFSSLLVNDSTITSTSHQISGLLIGTTYYWRVNSKISGGTSAYSSAWSFTTVTLPAPPILVAPINAAANQSTNPTLIWNSVSGAATYRLQVSLSPGFIGMVYDDSNRTNISQPLTGLTPGTTYYWRANAKNIAGTSAYSTAWSFTTVAPPAPPVLVSPVAAAQNQPTSLTFTWLPSTGAATYRLQVSTSAVFATTILNDSTITGTSQPITGLLAGTTYYWRVNAKNVAGTSAYSTRTFTTIIGGLQPPILVAPANASINISTSPTLSWNASTGAVTYRLQVDTSIVFASTVFDDSTINGLSQPLTNLINGETYYWRVSAKNSGGTSGYSTVWQFTVAASVPIVDLGTAARFGTIGGNAGITNQGIFTQVLGSLGTTAASTLITGFHDGTAPPFNVFTETPLNIGAVRDTIYTATAPPGSVPGAVANQALADAQTAFNYLAGLPAGSDPGAGELGGLTLAPGTYTSASGTFAITLLDLTLDAQGDPNAQFIFQASSSLTVGAAGPAGARNVLLINGAEPRNVFWVVGTGGSGSATINGAGGGTMVGTIIAYSGVTFSTVDNTAITRLEGRALSLVSSVTMVNTIITMPQP